MLIKSKRETDANSHVMLQCQVRSDIVADGDCIPAMMTEILNQSTSE